MDRHARTLVAVLLSSTIFCGGCRLFRPRPVVMELGGFQVETVTFPEGAYRSGAAGDSAAVARWVFQTTRGMVARDQTATRRYLLRVHIGAGADGKPAVRGAELVIASFDAGDMLTASPLTGELTLDEKKRLNGTLSGSWQWVRGTHAGGPITCPRTGTFRARLQELPFDPARAEALSTDFRRQEAWIRGGGGVAAPATRPAAP